MNKKLPWIIPNNSKFLTETCNICVFSSVCYALLCYSYDL